VFAAERSWGWSRNELTFMNTIAPLPLSRLKQMPIRELQALYKQTFGRTLTSGNAEYARRKIAWHLQATREGGLPESAKQRALAIARNAKVRVHICANLQRRMDGKSISHVVTTELISEHDSRLPMPGSILIKEHKGRQILVRVLDRPPLLSPAPRERGGLPHRPSLPQAAPSRLAPPTRVSPAARHVRRGARAGRLPGRARR